MRQVGFTFLIDQSFRHTELILLKPFSLKKCLKLLWIALLAGVLTSGSCNINLPSNSSSKKESTTVSESKTSVEAKASVEAPKTTQSKINPLAWTEHVQPSVWGIVTFFVILFFGWIIVLFLWLNARFEFVWWEAIVTNTTSIRDPFVRYREQGNSLFKFNLLMMVMFLILGGFIAWSVYSMFANGSIKLDVAPDWGSLLSMGLTFLLLFIVFFVMAAIFAFTIYPQIITLMALDHCRFSKAWEKFWGIYSHHVKDFWLYILVSFGISIAAGILTAIVGILAIIILLLVGLIIGGPIALLLWKSQTILWTVAIILGVPYVIAVIVILMLLSLPVAVFFRSFSLYFLSSLNCGYQPLPLKDASNQREL